MGGSGYIVEKFFVRIGVGKAVSCMFTASVCSTNSQLCNVKLNRSEKSLRNFCHLRLCRMKKEQFNAMLLFIFNC